MRESGKQGKNVKKTLASIVIVGILIVSIVFAAGSGTLGATVLLTEDVPSPPIDVQFAFSKPPALGVETQLVCSVISMLDVPSAEVTIEISKGFGLLSGRLLWSGNIAANTKFETRLAIKAVHTGNWTIRVNVRSFQESTVQSLLQATNELHVYVLENTAYINEYPPGIRPLCMRVENPPAIDTPLHHEGLVPENPQPFQPSNPGTLAITGRFWCYISQDSLAGHTSDTQQPMSWAWVRIKDTNGNYIGGEVCGPDSGDGEGYFTVSVTNPYPNGFTVEMWPWTSACHVVKSDDSEYWSYCGPFYPTSSQTTFDIGGWRPPDQWDYIGAWRIYESIVQDHYDRGAWDFMVNEGPRYTPPEVKVHFKMADGHGTHTHLGVCIDVDTEAYSKALDVVQHEYGHWVMYYAYGGYWPPNATGPHSINQKSNPNLAWTEGWADAFPLIVQSYGRWEDWYFEWGQGSSYDLENCPNCDQGDQCEGRVAGTFWDVFDSNKESYDYFVINLPWQTPNHFLDVWSVLSSQTDAKYLEFYQAWRAQGKDRHLLNYCSYQNTIVYDNSPDLMNGYVTPSSGYPKTSFRFYIIYQDVDWDPPGSTSQSSLRSESNPYGWIRLYVNDGGWAYYVMSHYSGNPESAETFYKDRSGFSVGAHDYYFLAYDGVSGGEDRYPDSGYLSFQVLPYAIHLESRENNGATSNLGTITFDGVSYNLPNGVQKPPGTYQATYYPASGYVFDHWETSGGITVPDPYGGPLTSVTVGDSGTLRAIYKQVVTVHLESRCEDGSVVNAGTITFDGTQYNLPTDVSKAAGTYQATYNPPADCVFLRWETSGGVGVSNANSQTTSVTVSSSGTLRAIFRRFYNTHLESTENNGATSNLGTITFDGVSYNLPTDASKAAGAYQATYVPASGYVFDHWETSGGVSVSSATDNPTTVTVSSSGTLRSVYKILHLVHLESRQDTGSSSNVGTITFDGQEYSLPNDVAKLPGGYQATYNPPPPYYDFDHWEVSGNIAVSDSNVNPTTVTVSGGGTLRAIYKQYAPVHLESRETNGATSNVGTITFDGQQYSLPNDILKLIVDYQATYNPPSGYAFDHWETTDAITLSNPNAQTTTVYVNNNAGGTLRAVYRLECTVHLESEQDNSSTFNKGQIVFDGTSYGLPTDISKSPSTYSATYNPETGYKFVMWKTSGGVSVSSTTDNPTSVTVNDDGALRAIYELRHHPVVYVDPADLTRNLDDVFPVNVSISDVGGLFSYEISMYYSRSILHGTSVELPSDHFLKPQNPSNILIAVLNVDDNFNSTHGRAHVAVTLLDNEPGKSGSGTLFKVTFEAAGPGVSELSLEQVILVDANSNLIQPDLVQNGVVHVQGLLVHLESLQNDSATSNLGSMNFQSVMYNLPVDFSKASGTYSATFYPAANYVFDHWETTGGVSVSGTTANPTSVTVGSSGGTLRAIYRFEAVRHPVVYVDPADLTRNLDDVFPVNVSISNVGGLWAYEISMYYSRSILHGVSLELPSDFFLKPQNPSYILIVDLSVNDNFNSTHGRAHVAVTLLNNEPSKSGGGTLFKVTFEAAGPGVSELSLEQVILVDANSNLIEPDLVQNGVVHVMPGLSIKLLQPIDNANITSSPILLQANVTSAGSPVSGAAVKFYVDGSSPGGWASQIGSATTDSNGNASISWAPTYAAYWQWYATADKTGYTGAISTIQGFWYVPSNDNLYVLHASSKSPSNALLGQNTVLLSASSQTIVASPASPVSITISYRIYAPTNPNEIDQLFFIASWTPSWPPPSGYYYPIYNSIPGTVPMTGSTNINLSVPSTPGTYYLWFCSCAHFSMQQAVDTYTSPLTTPAHVRIVVQGQVTCSYLVVRGNDNRIYYRAYDGSSWSDWTSLPGATCDSPAAAVCNNELHIVVRGMDGSTLWHRYIDLSSGTPSPGWTKLTGSTPSAPTLASNGTVICLVVRGSDNQIYYRVYTFSPRGWGGWNVISTRSTCDGLAAGMLENDLHIVARGFSTVDVNVNNTMAHIIVNPGGGVTRDWVGLSGATSSKPVLAANQTVSRLYLAVRGLDSRIYWRIYDAPPADKWASWTVVSSGSTCDGPSATVADNKLHFAVRSSDGKTLWHRYYDFKTTTYSTWTKLSGATPSAPTLTS